MGVVVLWSGMRKHGYTRYVESLWRVLRREGLTAKEKPRKKYQPKLYEQMQYPGQRVRIEAKVVPRACIADPEQSTYSSADFLRRGVPHLPARA